MTEPHKLKQNKKSFYSACFFCLSILLISTACKSEYGKTAELSAGMQPEEDKLNVLKYDSTSIEIEMISVPTYAENLKEVYDPEKTNIYPSRIVGMIDDPIFGRSVAGAALQATTELTNINFESGATADSAVLMLRYLGSYGDTTATQHIMVYEMVQDLYKDSTYHSDIDMTAYLSDQIIGSGAFVPSQLDSFITITLDKEVAERIIQADPGNLATNEAFKGFFKGVYLLPDTSRAPSCVSVFDVYHNSDITNESVLKVYYHTAEEQGLSIDFLVTNEGASFSNYTTQPSTAISQQADDGEADSQAYLSGMGGHVALLDLGGFDFFKQQAGSIVITNAELYLPVSQEALDRRDEYPIPSQLSARYISDSTNSYIIPDFISGTDYADGYFNDSYYHIRMTNYIQYLINGEYKDSRLLVYPSEYRYTPARTLLQNDSEKKIELKIEYLIIQ